MFGDRIEKIRLAYNWTQVQLAQKLNVSKQTVSNWENNNIQPSIDMLIRISFYRDAHQAFWYPFCKHRLPFIS